MLIKLKTEQNSGNADNVRAEAREKLEQMHQVVGYLLGKVGLKPKEVGSPLGSYLVTSLSKLKLSKEFKETFGEALNLFE